GLRHTCARRTDGTLWCWGRSDRIGTGGPSVSTPAQVTALGTSVAEVSASAQTCARKTDGSLWCWGVNDKGQVGDGTKVNRPTPIQIIAAGVVEVSAGGMHTCARKGDGTLWCWGVNGGDYGNGSQTDSLVPVQAGSVANPVELSAGGVEGFFPEHT